MPTLAIGDYSSLIIIALEACASDQQIMQNTPTDTLLPPIKPTLNPTLTLTVTLTPTITPSPTSTPHLIATEQYETFFSKLQGYIDAGYISSSNGKYESYGDVSFSLAKQGEYLLEMNGVDVKKFIVRSDVTIQTASRTSSRSGCGFVFSRSTFTSFGDAQIMLFLGQNGTAYSVLSGMEFNANYYDVVPNPGEVELTLIVNCDMARLLVNEREMIKWVPLKDITTDWGYTVISGSSDNFGTKCDFRNVDYWVIEE